MADVRHSVAHSAMVIRAAKRAVSKLARKYGYDLRRRPTIFSFLKSRDIDLVLDIGAHFGEFGHELRYGGYAGEIISFEPVSESFQALQGNIANETGWTAKEIAIGSSNSLLNINVSSNSFMNSFQSQSEIGNRGEYESEVIATRPVQVETLDNLASLWRGRKFFIKIDTQGFERDVLMGASECLKAASGIQLELPILHLYRNTWTLEVAVAFMRERGFVVSQLKPVNYIWVQDPVSFLEIDCIFRRKERFDD